MHFLTASIYTYGEEEAEKEGGGGEGEEWCACEKEGGRRKLEGEENAPLLSAVRGNKMKNLSVAVAVKAWPLLPLTYALLSVPMLSPLLLFSFLLPVNGKKASFRCICAACLYSSPPYLSLCISPLSIYALCCQPPPLI